MRKLSIIIPVYFNEETIKKVYEDLKRIVFPKITNYELIFVDDGSEDNSYTEICKIAEKDFNVKVVKLSRNFGSHAAILAGLSIATGDCATIKAADLQESSQLILDMYYNWEDGNDVVLAVRKNREDGFIQTQLANLYYWIVRKTIISSMPKCGFDCYLIDRKVIDVLCQLDEKNSPITLQILWAGFKRSEVLYVRKKREIGKSRWTTAKKVKLLLDSMISFSFFPIHFISAVGVFFAAIAAIWGIFLLINKLAGNVVVSGWTTLAIIVLFSSGLILLTLGILGEYLWRTMDAARNRPVYIVNEIKNADNQRIDDKCNNNNKEEE